MRRFCSMLQKRKFLSQEKVLNDLVRKLLISGNYKRGKSSPIWTPAIPLTWKIQKVAQSWLTKPPL